MVIRVARLLCCLILSAFMLIISSATADNTAFAYSAACPPPASCAPPPCPPPSCGPPSCGPGPFAICGACIGICTNICGAVIGIPAAIMAGILAPPPPPRPCGPPSCGPTMCAPPPCGPPPCAPPMCGPPPCAPAPITKCKPGSMNPYQMPYSYMPGAGPAPYAGSAPYMMPAAAPPSYSYWPGPPMGQGGLSDIISNVVQIPFQLVSGTLTAPGAPWGGRDLFAGLPAGSTESTFGAYW